MFHGRCLSGCLPVRLIMGQPQDPELTAAFFQRPGINGTQLGRVILQVTAHGLHGPVDPAYRLRPGVLFAGSPSDTAEIFQCFFEGVAGPVIHIRTQIAVPDIDRVRRGLVPFRQITDLQPVHIGTFQAVLLGQQPGLVGTEPPGVGGRKGPVLHRLFPGVGTTLV